MASEQKNTPEWEAEPLPNRLLRCIAMLRVHGMMSDSERERIGRRFDKAYRKIEEVSDD